MGKRLASIAVVQTSAVFMSCSPSAPARLPRVSSPGSQAGPRPPPPTHPPPSLALPALKNSAPAAVRVDRTAPRGAGIGAGTLTRPGPRAYAASCISAEVIRRVVAFTGTAVRSRPSDRRVIADARLPHPPPPPPPPPTPAVCERSAAFYPVGGRHRSGSTFLDQPAIPPRVVRDRPIASRPRPVHEPAGRADCLPPPDLADNDLVCLAISSGGGLGPARAGHGKVGERVAPTT